MDQALLFVTYYMFYRCSLHILNFELLRKEGGWSDLNKLELPKQGKAPDSRSVPDKVAGMFRIVDSTRTRAEIVELENNGNFVPNVDLSRRVAPILFSNR